MPGAMLGIAGALTQSSHLYQMQRLYEVDKMSLDVH